MIIAPKNYPISKKPLEGDALPKALNEDLLHRGKPAQERTWNTRLKKEPFNMLLGRCF